MENALSSQNFLKQKYQIIDKIGQGGYGITYRAVDVETNTEYAIKEFFPKQIVERSEDGKTVKLREDRYASVYQKLIKQFLFEARFLAKFSLCKNIVPVYEFFEENQTAYFVMKYLQGVNLREYIKVNKAEKKSVAINKVVDIMKQLLLGLNELHGNNIIHCDIKPSNIFVEEDGTIKIIDFGLAKNMDDDMVIGMTKMYVAPEIVTRSKLGSYSDVYSAGVVMYELLTLRCPPEAILRLNGKEATEPIKYNPSITPELNDIVMRAIAIDVENRFANAIDFIDAIDGKSKVKTIKQLEQARMMTKLALWGFFAISFIFMIVAFLLYKGLL